MAINWIDEQRQGDKPFMLMCQHEAPHRTWMPPLRHLHLYDDIDIPEPPTLFDDWKDNASAARHQEMEIDKHLNIVYDLFALPPAGWDPNAGKSVDKSGFRNLKRMTPQQLDAWNAAYGPKNEALQKAGLKGKDLVRWKFQRYAKNYLRCVKGVDESVGRVTAHLKQHGLDDNTIVIYSSDQGFYIGDHGWYGKRWMYDESLKMPLIVKWPGVTKPGSVNTELVQNLDYAETFLEIAGAKVPGDMQGRSLAPLLRGKAPANWRTAIYYHYFEYPSYHMVPAHYGIRTKEHKLIRFYQFDEWELYDLKNDPDEITNQYDNGKYASTISKLKQDVEKLRLQYKDDSDVSVRPRAWREKYRPTGT